MQRCYTHVCGGKMQKSNNPKGEKGYLRYDWKSTLVPASEQISYSVFSSLSKVLFLQQLCRCLIFEVILRPTRIKMGRIPLILVLVSAILTLSLARKNGGRFDFVFSGSSLSNDSGSNPGNNDDNTTVFESSLSTITPLITTRNREDKSQDTDCKCVMYYQCRNEGILITGETVFEDIRGKDECGHYLEICCKLPNVIPEKDVAPSLRIASKGCGVRNTNGIGFRITENGNTDGRAEFGEFPWVVAILTPDLNSTKQTLLCEGSLIHKQAVLTAGHCVQGKKPHALKIRAGEWDTQTKNEILPHQDRNVKSVIVHEKFHPGTLFYDFAILLLSEPVDIAENVDIVCLPEKDVVFDGSRCFASGWGKNKFNAGGQYQVILKKVELPIMPHDTCQNSLRNTRLGKYFILDDSFICAGGESGKDTCTGDGGGPLVCPSKKDPTRYQQAGIVAWGIGCGADGIPGVYANVAYARDWIDKQMTLNNFDNIVYTL